MSRNSQDQMNKGSISKLSDHQKSKRTSKINNRTPKKDAEKQVCGNCGKDDHTSKLNDRRKNCPAFDKNCGKCQTNGHFTKMCRGGPRETREKLKPPQKVNEVKAAEEEKEKDTPKQDQDTDLGTLSGHWMLINSVQKHPDDVVFNEVQDELSSAHDRSSHRVQIAAIQDNKSVKKLRHHVMNSFGKWVPSHVEPHGKVRLTIEVDNSAASQLRLQPLRNCSKTTVSALADTGAHMCVADWRVAQAMGLAKKDLMIPALSISVADNNSLELIGTHFMHISSTSGESTKQLVYFAMDVGEFYLSKSALIDLKIIPHDFPRIGACANTVADDQGPADAGEIYKVSGEFTSETSSGTPSRALQQDPNNSKGVLKDTYITKDNFGTEHPQVQISDVLPDWSVEFPNYPQPS